MHSMQSTNYLLNFRNNLQNDLEYQGLILWLKNSFTNTILLALHFGIWSHSYRLMQNHCSQLVLVLLLTKQTFISEELIHSGAPPRELFIGLLVCSWSCHFELMLAIYNWAPCWARRQIQECEKKRAPPNSRCEGLTKISRIRWPIIKSSWHTCQHTKVRKLNIQWHLGLCMLSQI